MWTSTRPDLHERFFRVIAGALAEPETTVAKKGLAKYSWSPTGRKRKPPTIILPEQLLDQGLPVVSEDLPRPRLPVEEE